MIIRRRQLEVRKNTNAFAAGLNLKTVYYHNDLDLRLTVATRRSFIQDYRGPVAVVRGSGNLEPRLKRRCGDEDF